MPKNIVTYTALCVQQILLLYVIDVTYTNPGLKINMAAAYINFKLEVHKDMIYIDAGVEINNHAGVYMKSSEITKNHKSFRFAFNYTKLGNINNM